MCPWVVRDAEGRNTMLVVNVYVIYPLISSQDIFGTFYILCAFLAMFTHTNIDESSLNIKNLSFNPGFVCLQWDGNIDQTFKKWTGRKKASFFLHDTWVTFLEIVMTQND